MNVAIDHNAYLTNPQLCDQMILSLKAGGNTVYLVGRGNLPVHHAEAECLEVDDENAPLALHRQGIDVEIWVLTTDVAMF